MAIATIGRVLGKAGLAYLKKNKSKIKKELDSPESKQKIQEIMDKAKKGLGKKMLTGGQAKIAAKAPPPNKIDEKDFKVLREEKAKGRGMGLQDEKVQPGKVMKAKKGHFSKSNVSGHKRVMGVFPKVSSGAGGKGGGRDTRTITEKGQFIKRRKKLMGAKSLIGKGGRLGAAITGLTIAGAGAAKLGQTIGKKIDEMKKKNKKMGGGMMKKYSKGGGADSGRIGEMKSRIGVAMNKAKRLRSTDRLTERDIEKAKSLVKNKKMPKAIAQGKRKKIMIHDMMPADTAMRTGSPMPRYSSGGESLYTKGYEGRKTGKGVRESLKDKVSPMKKERLLEGLKASGKMGGGMIAQSQRPGYSKGTMIKARGCKLGRTRPTKIT